jgi:hypothetical protein
MATSQLRLNRTDSTHQLGGGPTHSRYDTGTNLIAASLRDRGGDPSRYGANVTVSTRVMSVVYPVAGGVGAALTARAVLELARQFVTGKKTPPGRGSGGTALAWTALSWAVGGGVGYATGKKLLRPATVSAAVIQPAQS